MDVNEYVSNILSGLNDKENEENQIRDICDDVYLSKCHVMDVYANTER